MPGKRAPSRFTQRELAKAFRAAKSEGIDVQIKITRDGTLTINQLAGDASAQPENEWDKALGKPAPKVRPRV